MRKLRHLWQAGIAYVFFYIFRLLPPHWASALGGLIGRYIGLWHKGSRRAVKNLAMILPEKADRHRQIIRGMWDNIGRVLGEYAHLSRLWDRGYIEVVGAEHMPPSGERVVFIAAHLANWEVCLLVAAKRGWDMAAIYRTPNNPYIDPLLRRAREVSHQKMLTKSAEGGMELIRYVRRGGTAGLLVDQRLGDGIEIPFFGRPALTAPLPAMLAVRHGAKLLPVQVERLAGAHLRVTIHPVMPVPAEGTNDERVAQLTTDINNLFEDWIRQHPDQWLWSHNRWRLKKAKKKA